MITLAFAIPWTIIMILIEIIAQGWLSIEGLLTYILGGLMAGLLFALVMSYLSKKFVQSVHISLDLSESLIREGKANYYKNKEGLGGKMILSNHQLRFKSHDYNFQNEELALPLDMIKSVTTYKAFFIFPSGLRIHIEDGAPLSFIVDKPREWKTSIESEITKLIPS